MADRGGPPSFSIPGSPSVRSGPVPNPVDPSAKSASSGSKPPADSGRPETSGARRIPEATVVRLPVYQRILEELLRSGNATVSSEQLAASARINAAKVRKDLSLLGSFGTRGSGYEAAFLIDQIGRQLGLDQVWPVVIAGIGNLGRALANSQGFTTRGLTAVPLL